MDPMLSSLASGRGGRELSEGSSSIGIIVICVLGAGSILLLTVVKLMDDFRRKMTKQHSSSVTPLKITLRQPKEVPTFAEYVEMATPRFFRLDGLSFWQKMGSELSAGHPYVSCFTNNPSTRCPRVYRVFSLVVSVYVLFFVQMGLYDILHSQTDGTLHDHRPHRIVLMAFLGGVLSGLVTKVSHLLIVDILAADTIKWGAVQDAGAGGEGGTSYQDTILECSVGDELSYLLHDLRLYRSELSPEHRNKFNGKVLF